MVHESNVKFSCGSVVSAGEAYEIKTTISRLVGWMLENSIFEAVSFEFIDIHGNDRVGERASRSVQKIETAGRLLASNRETVVIELDLLLWIPLSPSQRIRASEEKLPGLF